MIENVKIDSQTGAADGAPTGTPEPERPASLGKLVEQISDQASRLVRAEIALAKAELAENAKKSGIGIGLLVFALLILAIGGFMLLVTAVLALVGVQLLKKGTTAPESVQRVKDDIASIKEGMHR